MDDPWGSPWATTDNVTAPSASPSKAVLEPPPPAFLSTPNNLTIPSAQSPWLDDDAFGDWASADPAQATNASPWTWGNEVAPIEQLTPSYEPRRKSSTPKWPRSRSASPGLRAPITPNSASSGHLSPDPWANHTPSFTKDEPEPIAHLPHIPNVPSLAGDPLQIELEPDTPKQILKENDITHEPATLEFSESIPAAEPKPLQPAETAAPDHPPTGPQQDDGPDSSSTSTTSDDDDEPPDARHADSPITSIEDNPLPKGVQRKASSKVQELVEMYDGIAKRTTVTPERQPPPQRSASPDHGSDADDASVYAHEDAESTNDEPATRNSLHSKKPVTENSPGDYDDPWTEPDEPKKSIRPDHDPFKVDLSQLDSLIPETTVEALEDAGDVSDRIINDSFTGISERKMWYRLSRHESLRRHNTGDDENYVRITWANSTVRQETMQIVRRWMEEDSMGGRAFRGGLARKAGGKFFGWDSTTETTPVDLDKVFGRKQKRQASLHRPTHSVGALPSLSTVPMVPGSKENTPASAQTKDSWEGFATFGWSSGGGEMKRPQEAKPAERTTFAKPLPLGFGGFDNTPKSHASLPAFTSKPMIATPPTVNTSYNKEEEVEDDDEWGDMVSPTTAEATDSTSIPKTSWDSFSTNPPPDTAATAPSEGAPGGHPNPDALGIGNNTPGDNKSGVRDFGSVISPASASTPAAPADVPQSQAGPFKPPASTYTFRPSSTAKRPPNISIGAAFNDPPAPSHDGKAGVSAGGLLDTPLTTGLRTPSTAQPRTSTEEDSDFVQRFVQNLPDLSYMLK